MASLFSHALFAGTITSLFQTKTNRIKLYSLAILCSILPDADVITFSLGIPYDHVLGHRGLFHSLIFCLLLAIFITMVFYYNSRHKVLLMIIFFLSAASHSFLDAFTNGGLGVAFFSPFDNTRYFFPWRPIQVSPIGAENFFGEAGLAVIRNEALWIGLPCILIMLAHRLVKARKTNIIDK